MRKSKSSNSSKKHKSRTPKGLVNVRRHTKEDGTNVKPHKRTFPDGIESNNLSYKGNKK